MEKELLKEPYQNAKAEIIYIQSNDVIQTSGEQHDGSNVIGDGWT